MRRTGESQPDVENPAEQLARGRLTRGNDAERVAAAAEDDIDGSVEFLEELTDESRGHAEVGIREKHNFPTGLEHAGLNGEALAVTLTIRDDAQARIAVFFRESDGVVGAGFVHDHDLGSERSFVQVRAKRTQSARQTGRLIAAGDDEGYAWCLIKHGRTSIPTG